MAAHAESSAYRFHRFGQIAKRVGLSRYGFEDAHVEILFPADYRIVGTAERDKGVLVAGQKSRRGKLLFLL